MKLGIVGSRRRFTLMDMELVRTRILALKPDIIISGGCKIGADRFAEVIAAELGISIIIFRPDLKRKLPMPSRRDIINAYYTRNWKVAKECDHLMALVAPDRKGGTENTIKYFRKIHGDKNLEIYKESKNEKI